MLTVLDGVLVPAWISEPRNLFIALYESGTTEVHVVRISCARDYEIEVDIHSNVWYYRRGLPDEESYQIGSGARVPRDGEHYGPMMVYDHTNPTHVFEFKLNVERLKDGTLYP